MKPKEPELVLDRRVIMRGNRPVSQILIKWKEEETVDATWEDFWVSTSWTGSVLKEGFFEQPVRNQAGITTRGSQVGFALGSEGKPLSI